MAALSIMPIHPSGIATHTHVRSSSTGREAFLQSSRQSRETGSNPSPVHNEPSETRLLLLVHVRMALSPAFLPLVSQVAPATLPGSTMLQQV